MGGHGCIAHAPLLEQTAETVTTGTTVLIVDDNERLAHVLRSLIDDEPGFRVLGLATSVDAALAHLAEFTPDVIVLDDYLHDEAGIDAVPRLRQLAPRVRVLLWCSDPGDISGPPPDGVDGVLNKGMTFREFAHGLRLAAHMRRPTRVARRSLRQRERASH